MQDHETLALEWALLNDPDVSPARIEAIMAELSPETLKVLIAALKAQPAHGSYAPLS